MSDRSPHSELHERVVACQEQIEISPYSHTIAAGWYAEDVPVLLEQLAVANELDAKHLADALRLEEQLEAVYSTIDLLRDALDWIEAAPEDPEKVQAAARLALATSIPASRQEEA